MIVRSEQMPIASDTLCLARGYPAARFWAEPIGERFEKVESYELYRVASNLVNGWPPRYSDHGGVSLPPPQAAKSGA